MLPCINLDIGRGHPNYLEGFLKVYPGKTILVKREWTIMKRLYLWGGRGGVITKVYNYFRRRGKIPKFFLSSLAKDLERDLKGYEMVLVSHPILAQMLKGRYRVLYLHGEIAAPKESVVDAFQIFVPLSETKERFVASGINEKKILVSGLMIEPEFLPIAEKGFRERIRRLKNKKRLTIAFFSSGAYPKVHLKKIARAMMSITEFNFRVFLFAGNNWRLKRYWEEKFPMANVVSAPNREEENRRLAEILEELDCFVAPAHERTNWACGLGLPLFTLLPHIGSYAPLNYEFAYAQGVCRPFEPEDFGKTVLRLQEEGGLLKMAEAGFGRFPIDGIRKVGERVRALMGDS